MFIFRYVIYCMKYVNMLLALNIKPILVFDGRHLPAKSQTEKKRRQYVLILYITLYFACKLLCLGLYLFKFKFNT